ncbi:cysteine desulfurase family protein [Ilyobacter polytropus]|uniref:cysteine desulfurase n=1 Tax=Ilyobacter polytropus (strain ATCC 51220 / DSM 2926 / LMG 16218 / CuHBu1) TaxID=572544 RepID=E3HDE5_ILYPC|nr:cysteine desulfurase family protein [Ilyobacter polytropus]ADO84548.1 Cysteine desulfurase [Ilyobacter polytropus DSM 2926]
MNKKNVYLDNNATTQMDERVIEVMTKVMRESYGNPSSVYQIGQKGKKILEESREMISGLLGLKSREIIFTSGGTESNNMAIRGAAKALKNKGRHLITSVIEHSSVLNTFKDMESLGWEVTYLGVDEKGRVNIKELQSSIKDETVLISIMHSNNEIGTLQPIREIGKIAKSKNIIFHVDGVQSLGKVKIDFENIDLFSFAAHKFYGPKGIGALYVKSGVKIEKLLTGGYQERNRRAGTENVVGVCGMARALEISLENLYIEMEKEKKIRDHMENKILEKIDKITINGDLSNRLFNTSSITFEKVEAESLLFALDMKGIAVSAGSACASSTLSPSHVLEAIALSGNTAKSTLRISLGRFTTEEDIDYFVEALELAVANERNLNII